MVETTGRVKLWFQDETRLGLQPRTKRRLTARGVKPIGCQAPVYDWTWLYGVVEPRSGQSFFMQWSHLDSACFQQFIDEFVEAHPNELHIWVFDGAPAHSAKRLNWRQSIVPVRLPAYSPELNPIERLWQHLKFELKAWYPKLSLLEEDMDQWLERLQPEVLTELTYFPYIRELVDDSYKE